MSRPGVASYLGLVVADLEVSAEWYARELGCVVDDNGGDWASLVWPNNAMAELFAGDPTRPWLTHPSYGLHCDHPVLPGYAVDDPLVAAKAMSILRRFPGWVVAVTGDGAHVVLQQREITTGRGLVAFRDGTHGPVPVVLGDRDETLADPDGTVVELVGRW